MTVGEKNGEVDIRIFYLCVHKKLNERVDCFRIMDKKEFYDILGRLYHLPKKLWICVLKEMVDMNMIEDLGNKRNNNIRVLPIISDPEERANEIYQEMGIF